MQSKVIGACGAEGTETDMKHRQQHIEHILRTMRAAEGVDDPIGAEQILALFAEDGAAAPTKWKPTPGEEYWFIWDTGQIKNQVWGTWSYDERRWNIGNCFQTRQHAERAREGLQASLRRFHAGDDRPAHLAPDPTTSLQESGHRRRMDRL
jgi:hypothetical protein